MPDFAWQPALLAWLATFAVHSSVLLCSAFLITKILPRGQDALCEWIWKTAMFGGLLTATAQVLFVAEPVFGHFDAWEEPTLASAGVAPVGMAESSSSSIDELSSVSMLDLEASQPLAEFVEPVGHSLIETSFVSSLELADWMLLAFAMLAILGVAADVIARLRLSYRLQGRRPVSVGKMPCMLTELGVQAGYPRAVRLTSSPRIKSPIAFGALWPEICVPDRALTELSTEQAQAMLAHELAHICRNDPVWLRLGGVLQCLFPWQILFRLANRDLQAVVELRCDSQAARWLGGGLPVAQCLVEVAGWLTGPRGPVVAGIPAMAVRGSALKLRVDRLLAGRTTGGSGWHRVWVTPGLLSLLATVAAVAPGMRIEWPNEVTPEAASRDLVEVDRSVLRDVVAELMRLLDQERDLLGVEVDGLEAELEAVQMTPEMEQMLSLLHSKLAGLDARREHFNSIVTGLLDAGVAPETHFTTNHNSTGETR